MNAGHCRVTSLFAQSVHRGQGSRIDIEVLRSLFLDSFWQPENQEPDATLFNHAMRHESTDRNPTRLVRQSAKRLSTPDCLTAEEIGELLRKLDGVYHVMAFVAAVTVLRVSELPALKWKDIDFGFG